MSMRQFEQKLNNITSQSYDKLHHFHLFEENRKYRLKNPKIA